MNDSSADRRIDAVERQMDELLRQFFSKEIPEELLALNSQDDAPMPVETRSNSPQLVSISSGRCSTSRQSQSKRLSVITAVLALAACALLVIREQPDAESPSSLTRRSSAATKPNNSEPHQAPGTPEESELMPVSPQGGLLPPGHRVIGDDGVTIEETDGVKLYPAPAPSATKSK